MCRGAYFHVSTLEPNAITHSDSYEPISIFEHENSAPDMLRLLVGKLPPSGVNSSPNTTLPVSPHYARLLAALAAERGFDGYLLNFEYKLDGGPEQARALGAWISMLEVELRKRVGDHAHAVWYALKNQLFFIITNTMHWNQVR